GGQQIIPVVAETLQQADAGVYGAVYNFTLNNPELARRSLVYTANGQKKVVVPGNLNSSVFPLAADPRGLQGLDPSIVLVDEIGLCSMEVWDALSTAAAKRPRNLILGLGTRQPGEDDN